MKKYWKQINWPQTLSYIVAAAAVVLIYLVLSHLRLLGGAIGRIFYYLRTFIWALVIAYVLSPLVARIDQSVFGFMKQRKASNALSVALTYLICIAAVALLAWIVVPQLAESITSLVSNLNSYLQKLEAAVLELAGLLHLDGLDVENLFAVSEKLLDQAGEWLTGNLTAVATTFYSVGSSIVSFILALILSVYLLLDWKRFNYSLRRFIRAVSGEHTHAVLSRFAQRSDEILKAFVRSNFLDSVIVGIITFLVMQVLRQPYAILISVLMGVMNIIPTFGYWIGYVPSVIILFLVNPWYFIWFTLQTIIIHMIDGNVIKPKLFGDAVGLSGLWVLASIIVGGRLGGILGMLLSVPVTAIVAFMLEDIITACQRAKNIDEPPMPDETRERRMARRAEQLAEQARRMREKSRRFARHAVVRHEEKHGAAPSDGNDPAEHHDREDRPHDSSGTGA
ncbi:MAG: AI-2E family transporter [Clostridiales bacterium]|nr:AI-2E family transporter [Clostridiales bacterium]